MIKSKPLFLLSALVVTTVSWILYLHYKKDISVKNPSEDRFWKHQIAFKSSDIDEKVDEKRNTDKRTSVEEPVSRLGEEIRPVAMPMTAAGGTEDNLETKKFTSYTVGRYSLIRDILLDGSFGPQMVIIPAGSFRMGYIDGDDNPGPEVPVDGFAMGCYEVTFYQYDKFAEATDREKPDDEAWGRGNMPVIHVSKNDAIAYTEWLSQQTGKTYRLPTEVEWEYAARAGSSTAYWWGDEIGTNWANCDGCGSEWDSQQPAPVGCFSPNAFGLHDMLGNVWEWAGYKDNSEERRHLSDVGHYMIRGGSFHEPPENVRVTSSSENWRNIDEDIVIGIRLVREM